ncbi:lyase family protein [Marinivivus vitaminiproducens]|uniref:lyase family protein n=1 Tax=Marinivivus vitaminiproducens TaxID=3035935 RepID=UPI0027A3CB96|nr:lyase family protein [Geminicoccaceae bacterium SCSIO 64248]
MRGVRCVAVVLAVGAAVQPVRAQEAPKDGFHWMSEINKASAVMVRETGIVPDDLGIAIARSLARVIDDQSRPDAARPGDVIAIENLMRAYGGPDVSRLHSGRSRKDTGATRERMILREAVLEAATAANRARTSLLAFARQDPHAIVPAYTEGVQAQPVSLGHYLTAYAEALGRGVDRLRYVYGEVNRSPLGSGALGTSSFPVDRPRLADLLGFDGVTENSMDATLIADNDTGAMAAGVANTIAFTLGRFVTEISAQYRMTKPWMLLGEDLTTASSIMPQKRNPDIVNDTHLAASQVFAHYDAFIMSGHNFPNGLLPARDEATAAVVQAALALDLLTELFENLNFDAERALAEVAAEYSTATELADVLQREADVPFRVGHHFASLVVTHGRRGGFVPADFPYDAAQRLFTEAAQEFDLAATELPLSEERFRRSLDARAMVEASRGLGGPQPAEVDRMMAAQAAAIGEDEQWVAAAQGRLDAAALRRDDAFTAIVQAKE